MSDSQEHDDPPATAGRSTSSLEEPKRFREVPKTVHDSVARYRLLWGLLFSFLVIFAVDVLESARYWKELHDVNDTLSPFVTLFATAIGSAITFYFTDRDHH